MPKATSAVSRGKRKQRSAEEVRKYKREWRQRNKQRIKESTTTEQIEARRAKQREYYAANKKRLCEYQKQYRAAHGDLLAEKKRQYRSRDPEKWQSYYKEYAEKNSERRKAIGREYYIKNCESIKIRVRCYGKRNADKVREKARAYRKVNAEKVRAYKRQWTRDREASDHLFRLLRRVGTRIADAIRSAKTRKSTCTIALLGCSPSQLASHLEKQFRRGMGWHNRSEWHIDHILPLASFDLADAGQQRIAFHYTNLQPLWKRENLSKGARLPDGTTAWGSRYKTARWRS